MMPDHLIDKAARAARENDRVGKWAGIEWEDLDQYTQDSYLNNARAALEAVAADIWDEGWSQGMAYVVGMERGMDDDHAITNPYRASETA